MSATAAFKAAWYADNARRVVLVKIDLATPSAKTLRLASAEVHTPDNNLWVYRIFDAEPIIAPGGLFATGPDICSTTYYLTNEGMPFQASGETFLDLAHQYVFEGATVTVYFWPIGLESVSGFVDFATDALQVFTGVIDKIASDYDERGVSVKLYLMQDRSWNTEIPTRTVARTDFPNAAEASLGQPLPIVYGEFEALDIHALDSSHVAYAAIQDMEDAGAGRGALPGIIVNTGTGAADVRYTIADHACVDLLDRAAARTQFVNEGGRLSPLATVTEVSASGSIEIADDDMQAYAGVWPVDVDVANNNATDPRNAMDPFNDVSYAVIDQGAATDDLAFIMPNGPALGTIVSVRAVFLVEKVSGTGNLELYYSGSTAGSFTPGSRDTSTISIGSSLYTQQWDFGNDGAGARLWILRPAAGAASLVARVYFAGFSVLYRPQRALLTPGTIDITYTHEPKGKGGGLVQRGDPTPARFPTITRTTRAPIFLVETPFYGHANGYGDDGSGTFAGGSAGQLLQRPCDILRHLLVTYGGLSASTDFVTGASSFGSWVRARTLIKRDNPHDLVVAVYVRNLTPIAEQLARVCEQTLCRAWVDRFTGKWMFDPWRRGGEVDWGQIGREEILRLSIEETSDVSVRHHIRMPFYSDEVRGGFSLETFVNPDASRRGFNFEEQGDNDLTVVLGVNDALDWSHSVFTTPQNHTLDAASYSPPIQLAANIRSKMRGYISAIHVGYGFDIGASHNDIIDFTVGASTYAATLPAGRYSSRTLAAAVVKTMTAAVDNGWACTYDDSTSLFTVTGTSAFVLKGSTGANYTRSGLSTLGFVTDTASGTSATATRLRNFGRFWFCDNTGGTITLDWASGTNSATNCANLIGYTRIADVDAAYTGAGTYPAQVGDRETRAAESLAAYGPKPALVISGDTIRNEQMAVDLKNLLFDFNHKPNRVLSLMTDRMVDIERMRVFGIIGGTKIGSLDDVTPWPAYGSDGSWDGVAFKVLSVTQHQVRSWHQEVAAYHASYE